MDEEEYDADETSKYLEQEEEINRRYRQRERKYFGRMMKSFIFGGSLAIVGFGSTLGHNITFDNLPIAKSYAQMKETSMILENELRSQLKRELPYQPEHIEQYLPDKYRNTNTGSLDKAIELVEKDIEELTNSSEFREYVDKRNSSNFNWMTLSLSGTMLALGGFVYSLISMDRDSKKKKREIEALRNTDNPPAIPPDIYYNG